MSDPADVRRNEVMTHISPLETMLWLLRHPEPETGATGICYGSLNVQLSNAGVRHAERISAALARQSFAAIYSSPSRRCLHLATILHGGRSCPLRLNDNFRELDFGAFEGRTHPENAAMYPAVYAQWMENPSEVQFPGGESLTQMRSRVLASLCELRTLHGGQSVAIVTHAGVIRIILGEALGISPRNLFRLGQRYGALSLLRYCADLPVVELMNAEAESVCSSSQG